MHKTLYRDGALADGRADRLRLGVSILVADGVIAWIRPSDDEGPIPGDEDAAGQTPGRAAEVDVVDASGSTFVPGMVDCHSHLTLPGGAHWIDRIDDRPERLLAAAERTTLVRPGSRIRLTAAFGR